MAHIFISYATADRTVAEEIADWLRAAGHEPFLDHDLRDGIGGEDWKQRLYRELRQVDAVLGLVTSSFAEKDQVLPARGPHSACPRRAGRSPG